MKYLFAPLLILAALPASAELTVSQPTNNDLLVAGAWLQANVTDPSVVVLHVADNNTNYLKGHIPQARFLSWSSLSATRNGIANELPPVSELTASLRKLGVGPTSRVIVYDEGAGLQAARAFVALDYVGLGDRSSLLDGHWAMWVQDKRPVSQDQPKITPSTFEPVLSANVIVDERFVQDAVWLKSNTKQPALSLLDARPPEQFSGKDPGEGITRGGHLPGAVNLYWMNHVESAQKPLLKSSAALRELFEARGIKPGSTVITYCRSGGQASHSYFLARYLGYQTRLYDGSYSEWSKRPENPTEK
jgi:thiosulfate/3-mercaptopyruvate sulfurtransferase